MPTPIGHALAGLAVAGVSRGEGRFRAGQVAFLVFCATAPDLDLALRFLDGVNHHRGPTHSLGAALIAAVAALALRRAGVGAPGPIAVGAAWASHVLLDFLGRDTTLPYGEMALWPFSEAFFISPVAVFLDIPRSFSAEAIRHNLAAAALEIAIVGPIAALCWRRGKRDA